MAEGPQLQLHSKFSIVISASFSSYRPLPALSKAEGRASSAPAALSPSEKQNGTAETMPLTDSCSLFAAI
jgi:hypothetical protein